MFLIRLMKEPVVNNRFKHAPLVILFEPVIPKFRRLGKRNTL